MGETVTVRLFVCTQTYDVPCDPRQPAKWLLQQAKHIQRTARHGTTSSSTSNQDELEMLYNRTKRIVIDLAEPIGKSISPMDVVDARTLLQTPDTTANASVLFPWLRSTQGDAADGITTCGNGLFFQQLYAYTLIGRRTPQLPSQRRQQEKQEEYLELLKTYVCGSFKDEPQYEPIYPSQYLGSAPARGTRAYMPPLTPAQRSPTAQRMQARGRVASDYPASSSLYASAKRYEQPQDRDSESSSSDNTEDSSRRPNGIAVVDTTSPPPPHRQHSLSYPPSNPVPTAASSSQRRPSASGSELEDMDNVFDIVFKQQAIGMKLGSDESKQFAVVKECFEGSEAKRYPEIQNGVVILAVNGQEVSGLGLSRVLYRLREAPRPVVVRFGRIGRTTHSHSQPQSRRTEPQIRSFWGS